MRTTTTSITFLAFFVGLSLSVANADPVEFAVFANANKINEVCTPDGMGMGDFPVCTDIGAATFNSLAVALGDVNNDGTPDAVFGGAKTSGPPLALNRVCLGDASGGPGDFLPCTDVSANVDFTKGVALGLLDGDANLDVVFANFFSTPNQVCLGDGSGGFVDGGGMSTCNDVNTDAFSTTDVALGFVDGDSNLDAVFANSNRPNQVCLGTGTGGFNPCSNVGGGGLVTQGVALGDVDGDGNLDAVFANFPQSNQVCLGDGLGGFGCSDVSLDALKSTAVALGFVNSDSNLDAVFANFQQPNRVCLGNGMIGKTTLYRKLKQMGSEAAGEQNEPAADPSDRPYVM